MKKVIKRKGYEEEFDPEKIKIAIEKAARDAGEPQIFRVVEDVSRIALEFCEDKEIIDSQDIREVILNYLKDKYPKVYEAWLNYDKNVKNR
jgi:transcriptional regulator NrdR family protein